MPDIVFVNSPKTEEKRWNATRKIIASSWYQDHGFLVVPELNNKAQQQIQVIFPKEQIYKSIDIGPYELAWRKVEGEFWSALEGQLPGANSLHEKVIVDLGRIGTVSSASWTETRYYLRADRSVADLSAMIVNHTMYVQRKQMGVTWTKREALMDFILTRPVMKRLFPDFDPVFTQLSRVPVVLRRESEAYVRSLGIVETNKEFERVGAKIRVKGREVGKELSKSEKKIMTCFIDHLGDLVTYDDLADILWGAGEFKSFWALNKIVERLRLKQIKLGIEGNRLESVRGQGYIMS